MIIKNKNLYIYIFPNVIRQRFHEDEIFEYDEVDESKKSTSSTSIRRCILPRRSFGSSTSAPAAEMLWPEMQGSFKHLAGGVLAANGKFSFVPAGARQVVSINP